MPQTRSRVVGSGFSTLSFNGRPIAFLDGFTDSGQVALGGGMSAAGGGPGWEAVTPLDAKHPVEWATSRVLMPGTLTITLRELWDHPVWWALNGLGNTRHITQVFERLASLGEITAQMIIRRPVSGQSRVKNYHNCLVTGIDDTEQVAIGTLTIPKNLTVVYSHTTR